MYDEGDPPGVVTFSRRMTGHFILDSQFGDGMHLSQFPFDNHYLTIVLRDWYAGKKSYKEHYGRMLYPYYALSGDKNNNHEWEMYPIRGRNCSLSVENEQFYDDSKSYRYQKQMVKFCIPISRKDQYYTRQIMGFSTCIAILGFVSYAFRVDELSSGMDILLTLLLTMVAFKFTINESMPKVPYETIMDKYLLVGFGFIYIIVLESSVS